MGSSYDRDHSRRKRNYKRKSTAVDIIMSPDSRPSNGEITDLTNGSLMQREQSSDCTMTHEINDSELEYCIVEMFGKNTWDKPCISARLFAYVLINITNKAGSSIIRQDETVLQLLKSFVSVEMTALQDLSSSHAGKTCFCSFDLSFLPTIIDSEPNLTVIETAVDHIRKLLDVIASTQQTDPTSSSPNTSMILLFFILDELRLLETDTEVRRCEVISSTMPGSLKWPTKRFVSGAKYYRFELEVIANRFKLNTNETGDSLQLEFLLAELIGRIIRYYLRLFFNAQPPILTTPSEKHPAPDFTSTRSRVHRLIFLHYKGKSSSRAGAAIADGSISSILNSAIRRIYDWNDKFLQMDINLYRLQELSPTSLQGLVSDGPLEESTIMDVVNDIAYIQKVLVGLDACRFVAELLTWPGIENAVNEVGGWSSLEKYAALFSKFQLGKTQPELIHFTMLQNVSLLTHRLIAEKNALDRLNFECQDRLKFIAKQFKCGTRNRKEGTEIIASLLKDAKEGTLPSVIARHRLSN